MSQNVEQHPPVSPDAPANDPVTRFAGKTLYFPERAQVSAFDSSLQDNMFQIALDGRRYCVDQSVLRTLEYFRRGVPAEKALSAEKRATGEIPGSPQLVGRLFDRGLLRTAQELEQETIKGRGPKAKRPAGMFFLVPILSEGAITSIASLFRVLFYPRVALVTGIGIVMAHLAFFFHKHAPHTGARLGPQEFTYLLGLVMLSLLFHEIGHAAASEHYGVHPHSLGFGVFWIYPVLFTDVSGTWQLKRWQRAIVGAAGLYFHLIASSIACLVAISIPSRLPVLLVYSIWLAVFLNGNPFLQFDGYWIVTDLLGIPNLRYQTHSYIKRSVARLLGKTPPDQGLWESSHRTRVLVAIYAVAYCGFIVYVINVVVRRILPRLFVAIPSAWQAAAQLIESERFDVSALLILWRLTVILITVAGLVRILHRVVAWAYRNLRSMALRAERRPA